MNMLKSPIRVNAASRAGNPERYRGGVVIYNNAIGVMMPIFFPWSNIYYKILCSGRLRVNV